MTTRKKPKASPKAVLKGKARLRSEIVEMTRSLHRAGRVSADELEQTTIDMLGPDAISTVDSFTGKDIVRLREERRISQAVLAAYLNVGISTVSQWERGARRPTGTALKLLTVIKRHGIEVLR